MSYWGEDPGREVLGRMPKTFRWSPSKAWPWWYGVWQDGGRLTTQQVETLMRLGRDPVVVETMEVRREASLDEVWVPTESWRPVYQFPCPVIGKGRGDLVRVIAPNGTTKDVRADGWAHKPSLPRHSGWLGF